MSNTRRQILKTAINLIGLVIFSFIALSQNVLADTCEITVYQAQKVLKEHRYNPGPLDGIWGSKTKAALKKFQQDKGLLATGRLNKKTKEKLCSITVSLLFYHQPYGCSHCAYQMPKIREFQKRHPEINLKWRSVGTLSQSERKLLKGISGHPVMVFYKGEHWSRVVGETSLDESEEELDDFEKEVKKSKSKGTKARSTGGSYSVCY